MLSPEICKAYVVFIGDVRKQDLLPALAGWKPAIVEQATSSGLSKSNQWHGFQAPRPRFGAFVHQSGKLIDRFTGHPQYFGDAFR